MSTAYTEREGTMHDEGCARCGSYDLATGDLCGGCDEERWAGVVDDDDAFARALAVTRPVTEAEFELYVAEGELVSAIVAALEAASAALDELPALMFGTTTTAA